MGFNCYVVYLSFSSVVDLRNTVGKFKRCKSTDHHWWRSLAQKGASKYTNRENNNRNNSGKKASRNKKNKKSAELSLLNR